jgi:hypothetical protein
MKLSKKQAVIFDQFDNAMNELNKCGDEHCGDIITSSQIKEEESKFFKLVTKKCRSKKIPKTEKENKRKQQKYDKCFTKYKNRSKYYKNLTRRKKCEDEKCSVYQNKIKQMLLSANK